MPGHILLNNDLGDGEYDQNTTTVEADFDGGAAVYAYAEGGNDDENNRYERVAPRQTFQLSGRGGYLEPPPVPARAASVQQVKVVEIQHINLWPLWSAVGVTAIIAIAALAQSAGQAAEPRSTPAAAGSGPLPSEYPADPSLPPLPPTINCYCTSGTLSFAATDPGPCYLMADGKYGTPNLLQNGGLYVRPGPPAVARVVLDQATAVNGLAINVTTRRDSKWPSIYGPQCEGEVGKTLLPTYLPNHLSADWPRCSNGLTSTATLEGDAETRPPSMYLVPYMCR